MRPVTYALSTEYTDESILGGGAIKGKNAIVKSITPVDGGNEVTFGWTLDDGTEQTQTMFVANGADGADGVDGKDGESVSLNMPAVTLEAAGWVNNKQTVNVAGALADESQQAIIPMPVELSREAYQAAKITTFVPTDGVIEFTAETVPTDNLFLYVALFGVTGGASGGESTIAWYPSVDADSNISWSRISTTTAPPSTNIRGAQGEQGIQGEKGEQGLQGAQGLQGIQGERGEKGEQGVQGAAGVSPTLTANADNTDDVYKLDITDANGSFTTPNLVGRQGAQGIQGEKGEKGETGEQGIQGIQGIQGEKGNDGYPFLIYKEYTSLDEFSAADFPEIGLMFMVNDGVAGTDKPVYRYTGETDTPYSHITDMSTSEGLKGDKGDKGDQGEQGIQGEKGADGVDGITYTPVVGTVQTVTAVQDATAEVVVDSDAKTATFNFSIPRGAVGQQGLQGEKGETGADGAKGADGTTYTPAIGTVETVDSALSATANVAIDTDTKQAVFNFAIPRGVGVSGIAFTSTTDASGEAGKAGATDTYTITYTDGKTSEYKVYNGADGAVISDNEISADKTWSSKQIDSAKLTTIETHFTGLGFSFDETVSVGDFLSALIEKCSAFAYINMHWSNSLLGYVTDGNLTVQINGGLLLLMSSGRGAFPDTSWQYAEALYLPMATETSAGRIYKFVGRVDGTAGTIAFEKIYAYSGQTTADVAVTPITALASGVTQIVISGSGNSHYQVVNGICYFQLYVTVQEAATEFFDALTGLPKPKANTFFAAAPYANATTFTAIRVNISTAGTMRLSHGVVGGMYMITGSYPVA